MIKWLIVAFIRFVANCIPCGEMLVGSKCAQIKVIILRTVFRRIGDETTLARMLSFEHPGNIEIGSHVYIGNHSYLCARSMLVIGDRCMIADRVSIISGSHNVDSFDPAETYTQNISIGPGVWIGASVTILGGVSVGRGSVIGAGALVKSDVPDFAIVAGVPAKIIGTRVPTKEIWSYDGHYALDEII